MSWRNRLARQQHDGAKALDDALFGNDLDAA